MKIYSGRHVLGFALVISMVLGITGAAASANFNSSSTFEHHISTYSASVAEKNESLYTESLEGIITTITFSDYLTFPDFEAYVQEHSIKIVQLQLRAIDNEGTRITIFTRTDRGLAETEALLTRNAEDDGYSIVGITGMNALVDSQNLQAVCSDSRTYLADTSGDNYSENMDQPDSIQRNKLMQEQRGKMFPQPLTWDLEEAGILSN